MLLWVSRLPYSSERRGHTYLQASKRLPPPTSFLPLSTTSTIPLFLHHSQANCFLLCRPPLNVIITLNKSRRTMSICQLIAIWSFAPVDFLTIDIMPQLFLSLKLTSILRPQKHGPDLTSTLSDS